MSEDVNALYEAMQHSIATVRPPYLPNVLLEIDGLPPLILLRLSDVKLAASGPYAFHIGSIEESDDWSRDQREDALPSPVDFSDKTEGA